MIETVAAIVVTYNRKELLIECLEGLRTQSRPLDRIFIIDNASTDGTSELLRERGFMADSRFEYVCMQGNTGGAGGFHAGVKRAFEAGYDCFWLMDDDVEPYSEGLESLLKYRKDSGCVHGRRRNPDGSAFPWGDRFHPSTVTMTQIGDPLFTMNQEVQEINVGCFEGMLIGREVVAKIGFPDPEFFIGMDDTFYGYLASHVTRVLYVNVFSLRRKRSLALTSSGGWRRRTLCRLSPLALYYAHRNRFLIARTLGNHSLPFALASLRTLVRSLLREFIVFRSAAGGSSVLRGFRDGIRLMSRTSDESNDFVMRD